MKSGDNNYFADMSTSIAVTSQVSLRQTAHLDYKKTDDLSDIKASLKVQEFQNLTSASPYELKPSFNVSYKKDWEDKADQSLFLQTDANFSMTSLILEIMLQKILLLGQELPRLLVFRFQWRPVLVFLNLN